MFKFTTPALDCDERKAGEGEDRGVVRLHAGWWAAATFPSTEDLIAGYDNLTGPVCRRMWMKETAFVTAWHQNLQLQFWMSDLLLSFWPFVHGRRAYTRVRAHAGITRGGMDIRTKGGRGG